MKRFLLAALGLLMAMPQFAQEKIKVACVGNSITYGIGVANPEVNAYPVKLQGMLGDKYEVGNFGKPGATLLNKGHRPYTQQQEYKDALAFAGDIVVIHLGINDTDPRNWPNYRDEFVGDYRALMQSFREANPKCRFILARMTPLSDRHKRFESGTRDWHAEIQLAIECVARAEEAQLIDFHTPLYPYPYLLEDAVHPNAEGAAILAKTVYEGITGQFGGLQMSDLYTDNMVLQYGRPLVIHGKANAGDKVTVSIAGQKVKTETGSNGKWAVVLNPLKAGGPYDLKISTKDTKLEYKNVLAGEVWLCSGQSNMAFRLDQSATGGQDIPQANHPRIRLFDMQARWHTYPVEWDESVLDSLNHLQYFKETTWTECSPQTAALFSGVGYYFGKMLQENLDVPIGLICNAVGGSPIGAWVDRRTLEYGFPAILRDWRVNDFIQDWVRGRASLNIKKSTYKFQRHPYEPCYLYESGILPLQQYPIRGVIWYQGESNAHNKEAHEKLFKLLVSSWRTNWNDADMPFYYVQLSGLNRPSWPWFRDSQRQLMQKVRHTGMVVSSDKGDSLDVHPIHKKEIGERLARWALNKTYGKTDVVPSGPLADKVVYEKGAAYVSFEYGDGLKASDGKDIRTFEVAGDDMMYYPAHAVVEGNRLKVWSDKVKEPKRVRYGWQPFTRANLVNAEGLPASTFQF